MLKDCLEIFGRELRRTEQESGKQDKLILDTYIPADGTYVIVNRDNTIKWCNVKFNKKTREVEGISPSMKPLIRHYDYHSQLVSMDKPQDPKKVIHSNNYLSFWIKQESLTNGKLTPEAIDRYFDVLADPKKKYTKPQDRQMYEYIEGQVGAVDQVKLERSRTWIHENIFNLTEQDVELTGKNYLKIYFEDDESLFVKEGMRYTVVKIYNKNDYNLKLGETILGLPNDNMDMNSKKPFKENKNRKISVPYLIDLKAVLLQKKFFDYLMNLASAGKTNVYFDSERGEVKGYSRDTMMEKDFTGFLLQIQKSKEVIIQHQDSIVDYRFHLRRKFRYENVLNSDDKEELYKEYGTVPQIQYLIDNVLYSKWLIANYFTPIEDLQLDGELKRTLARTRDAVFAWLYKDNDTQIGQLLTQACLNMTKASILNNTLRKAQKQFNLWYSFTIYFEGGRQMAQSYMEIKNILREKISQKETQTIDSDKEYFFAVGQLVNYFVSLNKSKEKPHSLANPFFNASKDEIIRVKLRQFFMKYNYQLNYSGRRFNNLYGMIANYKKVDGVIQEAIIAGYLNSNLIYESKKEEEDDE